MLVCDWPIGTPAERAAAQDRLPGSWISANGYLAWYRIGYTKDGEPIMNWHTGADLNNNAPVFNTDYHSPIYAIADGRVVYAGIGGGTWGHIIVIEHIPGQLYSRVGHIEKPLVKTGDSVIMGQQIASVGNGDGAYIGAEHLHFDISTTARLRDIPNDWPGVDKSRAMRDYVDPIAFIVQHKAAAAPQPEKNVTTTKFAVNSGGLNFRMYYSSTSPKLLPNGFAQGTQVNGYDLTVPRPDYTWRLIEYNGSLGWVADKFLTPL